MKPQPVWIASGESLPRCQALHAAPSVKLGIVGITSLKPRLPAATRPVPRGPNSHLWQLTIRKSHPSDSIVMSWLPKPWTPSSTNSTWSGSSRDALIPATASAIFRAGILRPLEECTQVSASTRVSGLIAVAMRSTSAASVISSMSSNSGMRRTVAPARRAASRVAS